MEKAAYPNYRILLETLLKTLDHRVYLDALNQTNNKLKYGCILGDCENGKGKMVWGKDSTYVGDWVNGKRDGQGEMIYKNGDKYIIHGKCNCSGCRDFGGAPLCKTLDCMNRTFVKYIADGNEIFNDYCVDCHNQN